MYSLPHLCSFEQVQSAYLLLVCTQHCHHKQSRRDQSVLLRYIVRTSSLPTMVSSKPLRTLACSPLHPTLCLTVLELHPNADSPSTGCLNATRASRWESFTSLTSPLFHSLYHIHAHSKETWPMNSFLNNHFLLKFFSHFILPPTTKPQFSDWEPSSELHQQFAVSKALISCSCALAQ